MKVHMRNDFTRNIFGNGKMMYIVPLGKIIMFIIKPSLGIKIRFFFVGKHFKQPDVKIVRAKKESNSMLMNIITSPSIS